jgi:hypothetical protein
MPMFRWQATVHYRGEADVGAIDIVHDLAEISDLHDLIEHGPHWDTIIRIEIVRADPIDDPDLTVDAAERL